MNVANDILQALIDQPMLLDRHDPLELGRSDDDGIKGPAATRDVLHLQVGGPEAFGEELVDLGLAGRELLLRFGCGLLLLARRS